ncbi:MAG: phage baseplate assembly protein V, partial [Omnitrophica WOR_2 bacterium]
MDKPVDNQERVPRKPKVLRYGVYRALVVDQADPEQQGRIKVQFPWQILPGAGNYEAWARPVAWVAGDRSGVWSAPAAGSEVLIAFEGGDPRQPYLIGSLWNEADRPPEAENNRIILRTSQGV